MKLGAIVVAAAACVVASPTRVTAQRDHGLLTALQREMEKSTQLLEQFWDAAFGSPQDEDEDDAVVVVAVVEKTMPSTDLTKEEKAFACRVAVERIDEQAALARAAQRMTSRLRTPLGRLVTLHFDGETSCDDLEPPALVRECKRVAAMDREIAQFLREGKTHDEICDVVQMVDELMEDGMPVADPPLTCKLCKRFVKMVDDAVKQDMQQVQQMREILGDICDSMATDSMCHTFLKRYDDVVDWLIHGTDPQVVCERLTMCTAVETAMEAPAALAVSTHLAPIIGDNHACFYCEHLAGAVASFVQHAPNQLGLLHKVVNCACKLAPKDCKCSDFSKNFDKIVDWTKQGQSPELICTTIGMCKKATGDEQMKKLGSASNPLALEKISSLSVMHGRADNKCFYCEYFTTLLEVAIQEDEQDMDQIREFADMICGVLGDNKFCQEYVSKLDTAMDDIKKGEKPREICTDMLFCTKKQEVAPFVLSSGGGDNQCLYCDYFVTLLEVAIQEDDADIEQVKQYADLICGMLGDDSVCHQYVDKFDAAVDELKKGKTPHQICAEFKFCSKAQQLALPPPLVVHGDQKCFYCDYFVTILEIVIQEDKADIDQVREFADMICGMLGDDNVCHQYVDKFDAAIDGLRKGKKPREICIDLKFCTKKVRSVALPVVHVTNDKKCLYCDYFVSILEVFIVQDDTDINLVRQYADMICGMLGDDNVCHQYVAKFDTIVDELKLGKKPHQICTDIKFCTAAQRVALPAPVAGADNKTCFYCDYITTILEVALQEDPNDVDAVRLYAEIVCGMLGDGNVCHQYVDKLNYAIESLKKGQKPRAICAAFKYCTAKQLSVQPSAILDAPSLLKDAMVKHVVEPATSGVDDCFFCTQVANLIKVAIAQDPSKVTEIRTVADLICKTLPAANKCHAVMHEMDQIIDSIRKGEDPQAICRDMKFCPARVPVLPDTKVTVGATNNDCAYCDGVVTVLEYALKTKPDQIQQLRDAAGIVCDFMPKDDKCHEDLKLFDKAVTSLKSGKSPHAICVDLTLCPTSSTSKTSSKLMPSSIAKLNMLDSKTLASKAEESEKSMSIGCLLCEYTAEALRFIKGDQNELRLAKEALENMCFVLPPTARCDVLSSKFDNLVQLVGEGKSPSQACHAIHLCDAAFVEPASSTQPKRIGGVVADQ